jgi:hypothetical protein
MEELADQIHLCFLQLETGNAPDSVETETARAFDFYYRRYLELGGKPFRLTKNWLGDLVALEERCRGEIQSTLDHPDNAGTGQSSKPMKKAEIREVLGVDSYYILNKLAEEGVYQLRRDPTNRQRWMIRLAHWTRIPGGDSAKHDGSPLFLGRSTP